MNLLKQLREMQAILQTIEDFIGTYSTQTLQPAMKEIKIRGIRLLDDVINRVVLMKKEGNKYIHKHSPIKISFLINE